MDDSENVDYGSALLRGTKVFGNFMKIHMVYRLSEGFKYTIKIRDASKSCVVSVIDKTQNRWIARVDMAHKNVPYKHININPKYAKIAKDPHIKIPSVGMQVYIYSGRLPLSCFLFSKNYNIFIFKAGKFAAKTAKVLNKANEVIGPALLIADIGCVGYAAYKDYSEGTISNTTNTVTKIGSGYLSSYAGKLFYNRFNYT